MGVQAEFGFVGGGSFETRETISREILFGRGRLEVPVVDVSESPPEFLELSLVTVHLHDLVLFFFDFVLHIRYPILELDLLVLKLFFVIADDAIFHSHL